MHRHNMALFEISCLWLLPGCTSREPVAPGTEPPTAVTAEVLSASVIPNPHSVLSALVPFAAEHADSARVVMASNAGAIDSTPYLPTTAREDTLIVLGLRPSTEYRNVVEVKGPAGSARSDTLSFATGVLPELLQRVEISTTGSTGPGFTLTSVQVGGHSVYALAFDSAGAIRWYRRFEGAERVGGELKQQQNGRFTLYRGTSHGSQQVPGQYIEFTPAGDSVRALTVSPPRYLDNHELLITTAPDGGERFHFFTYDFRPTDLSSRGGSPDGLLAGHQLIRQESDGTTVFEWNAWEQLSLRDWIETPPADLPGEFDFDHPNSIAFDLDRNYIVSFRRLNQIVKIDAGTGAVVWRLGGRRNEFSFLNDPLNGPSGQHCATMLSTGHLLVFDNGSGHTPPESRAVEYALDPERKTATLVWEFRKAPPVYTPSAGSVQRLQNGNTMVGFAQVGRAVEVDAEAKTRWEAEVLVDGRPAFVYRLIRIGSLYRYQQP